MLKVDLSWQDDDQRGNPDASGDDSLSGGAGLPEEPEPAVPSSSDIPQFDLGPEELLDHIDTKSGAPEDRKPESEDEDSSFDSPPEFSGNEIPDSEESPESGEEPEAEPEAAPEPEAEPEPAPEDAEPDRRKRRSREKVRLSDRLPESPVSIPEHGKGAKPRKSPRKTSGKTWFTLLAAAVLVGALGAAVYFGYGRISLPGMKFPDVGAISGRIVAMLPIHGKKPVPAPAPVSKPAPRPAAPVSPVPDSIAPVPQEAVPPAPPAVLSKPEPPAEAKSAPAGAVSASVVRPASPSPSPVSGGNAALVVLRHIGQVTPDRVWLTAITAGYGGSYTLEGVAFSYSALGTFVTGLEKAGTVSAKTVPPESDMPGASYHFSVAGKLRGGAAPGALQPLTDERVTDSVKRLRGSGLTVVRLPRLGEAYGDGDLPFEVEGPYSRTGALLGKTLSGGGYVVYRASIRPAGTSREGNKVRIAFSLRMGK